MSKVLIVGRRSRLAEEVVKFGDNEYEIWPHDGFDLDIGKASEFDVILNCAAITGADDCEKNYHKALKVNSILPLYLEEVCIEAESRLVHICTNYSLCEPGEWNRYAMSKAIGSSKLKRSQIIYTSFFTDEWTASLSKVNCDFGTIKAHISPVAQRIATVLENPNKFGGWIYIGNPNGKRFYSYITKYNQNVEMTQDDKFLPPVRSMIDSYWNKFANCEAKLNYINDKLIAY